MKTKLFNQSGEIIGDVDLPDKIFGVAMNAELVKQVIDAQAANSRQVIAHAKDRSEVRGGGRKPWRQKGTGRARHASIRSPIWRHGGVAFGPTKERNFEKKINKKMKRKALFMALSSKANDKELLVLDELRFETPKTKAANNSIKMLSSKLDGYRETKKKKNSILLVAPAQDKNIARAVNNLSFIEITSANSLNIKDVLTKKYLILLKDAVPIIERTFRL
ncbi:MAG: 50S ribosomal protein L4 [Candidatus Yanofskybacteria bacterium]|nr:50S ribosomal protein L4 [Candidatus Yanofskybacteria bacterium]